MKITKERLKRIIKEELGGVLKEMGPEFPGEKLPQGAELDQALSPSMPSDIAEIQAQISELESSFQGLDTHGRESGFRAAAQEHLIGLYNLLHQLKGEFGR